MISHPAPEWVPPRFIRSREGDAIAVAHIVRIYITQSGKGYVVRCDTVLKEGEFVNSGGSLNLSNELADKEVARQWMDATLSFICGPRTIAESPQK